MSFVRTLLIACLSLWSLAIVLGVIAFALDSPTLTVVSMASRRIALPVTILWAIFAGLGALIARFRVGWTRRR